MKNDVSHRRARLGPAALLIGAGLALACSSGGFEGPDFGLEPGGAESSGSLPNEDDGGGEELEGGTTGAFAGDTAGDDGLPAGGETGGATTGDHGYVPTPSPVGGRGGVFVSDSPSACTSSRGQQHFAWPDDTRGMISPVLVREAALQSGSLPPTAIRPWEFLNFYSFDFAPAEPGTLRVSPHLVTSPSLAEGEYLLQVAVTAEQIPDAEREPVDLTLILDTSESMALEEFELLQASARVLFSRLRTGDVVTMVSTSAPSLELSAHAVTGPDDPVLLEHLASLAPAGRNELRLALELGYHEARRIYDRARMNRVVVMSDGEDAIESDALGLIATQAEGAVEDPIITLGVAVGSTAHGEESLRAVSEAGRGPAVMLAAPSDAERVFGTDFVRTLAVAAYEVQIELQLPPGLTLADDDGEPASPVSGPQPLGPNKSMLFHQRLVACDDEGPGPDDTVTVIAHYLAGAELEKRASTTTVRWGNLSEQSPAPARKATAVHTYAEALAELSGGRGANLVDALDPAVVAIEQAEQLLPEDPDLREIRAVLDALLPPLP